MKFVKLPIGIAIAFFAISACKKSNPAKPSGVNVYVSGTVNINTHSVPAYWKNGQITIVDDQLTDSWLSPRIAVNGSDIYLVGRDSMIQRPVYWKNGGKPTILDLKAYTVGDANSVVFSGNDMYISGFVSNGSSVKHAAYWKNGVLNLLDNSANLSVAYDAFTNGADVYIIGMEVINSVQQLCYWKNGNSLVKYNNPLATFSYAWSGNNFYTAGETVNSVSSNSVNDTAAYSVNGNITKLPNGKEITGIVTNGADVFMSGLGHDLTTPGGDDLHPMYWKNNVPTQLSKSYGFAEGISMDGTDVYIAGYLINNSPYKFLGAYYWKNATAVQLNSSGYTVERVNGIAVVRF